MRAQQNLAIGVAHHIGEVFVVFARRRDALTGVVVGVPADDIASGKRKEALPGFLERAVEHLVHFVAQLLRRHHSGNRPEQGDT